MLANRPSQTSCWHKCSARNSEQQTAQALHFCVPHCRWTSGGNVTGNVTQWLSGSTHFTLQFVMSPVTSTDVQWRPCINSFRFCISKVDNIDNRKKQQPSLGSPLHQSEPQAECYMFWTTRWWSDIVCSTPVDTCIRYECSTKTICRVITTHRNLRVKHMSKLFEVTLRLAIFRINNALHHPTIPLPAPPCTQCNRSVKNRQVLEEHKQLQPAKCHDFVFDSVAIKRSEIKRRVLCAQDKLHVNGVRRIAADEWKDWNKKCIHQARSLGCPDFIQNRTPFLVFQFCLTVS